MGWVDVEVCDHEGYTVGLVKRTAKTEMTRELGYPDDDRHVEGIREVKAACDCGWRSETIRVAAPAAWSPFCVTLSDGDDSRVYARWVEHIEQVKAAAGRDPDVPRRPRPTECGCGSSTRADGFPCVKGTCPALVKLGDLIQLVPGLTRWAPIVLTVTRVVSRDCVMAEQAQPDGKVFPIRLQTGEFVRVGEAEFIGEPV